MSVGSCRKLIVNDGYLPGKNIIIYSQDISSLYLAKMAIIEGAVKVTIIEPSKGQKNVESYLKDIEYYDNIKVLYNTKIIQIIENGRITGVRIKNAEGNEENLQCDSLLLSVGIDPSRRLFKKFRRGMDEIGMYVAGNADEVSFDLNIVIEKGNNAGIEASEYIQKRDQQEVPEVL